MADVTPLSAEFTDPRLVAIYDVCNTYSPGTQPDFYRQLAAELGASSIVDLGCGTGLITCDLAAQGYHMIGVEPAPPMLAVARQRPYGDRVRWIEGGAGIPPDTADADLAIMSGHVAQFFLTDESWHAALTALHAALRPGGHLAFESRNPAVRAWSGWAAASRNLAEHPTAGRIEFWSEADDAAPGIVAYTNHYLFAATGEELVLPGLLRFRSEDELIASLARAGFGVEHVYGDWDRGPAGPAMRELIVVARRR